MKHCILTWFSSPNYGTFLQAFALQTFLTNNNYNNSIANFKPNGFLISDLRKILFFCFPYLKKKFKYQYTKSVFDTFARSNLKLSKRVTIKNIKSLNKNFDVFISGSDQIWNPEGKYKNIYLLDFCYESKKLISIASSMGGENIDSTLQNMYYSLLKRYSFISVREKSTKDLLEKMLNKADIRICLDPVFLLSKTEWNNIIGNIPKLEESYIFCYFLGYNDFYIDELYKVHKKYPNKKMLLFCLGNEYIPDCDFLEKKYFVDPFNFLAYLKNSLFVITDSFHATVFSTIFEKKFIHFLRFQSMKKGQNIRVLEFIKQIDCLELLVTGQNEIDWSLFDKKSINTLSFENQINENKNMIIQVLEDMNKEL